MYVPDLSTDRWDLEMISTNTTVQGTGNTVIESLGVYLPKQELSSEKILSMCESDLSYPLERVTGIQSRRIAAEDEYSIDIAKKAVQVCLDRSRYGPTDIDMLICCNISRYDAPGHRVSMEPNTSIKLKSSMGFDRAIAFDVSNALHTQSKKLHHVAIEASARHVAHVLERAPWHQQEPDHVIMHQVAKPAISQLAQRINDCLGTGLCSQGNMVNNLAQRGNTSTTTHFLALWDGIHDGSIQSGDSVLFTVQASGITLGTALYTVDDLPDRIRRPQPRKPRKGVEPANRSMRFLNKQWPRIGFESIGTTSLQVANTADSIDNAVLAAESCLSSSEFDRSQVDLLIHAGVYRSEFLLEPAMAAIIAGKLELNADAVSDQGNKTFAFDVFNGSVGFLNACHTAVAMIRSQQARTVMVVASEIDHHADNPEADSVGVCEAGSAMILCGSDQARSGFGPITFKHFPEHLGRFSTCIENTSGSPQLQIMRDPFLEQIYVDCAVQAVAEFLKQINLNLNQVSRIIAPQISDAFLNQLSASLDATPQQVVRVPHNVKNLYTSSIPFTIEHAFDHHLVEEGDIALIVEVGSGVQVGCGLYYF